MRLEALPLISTPAGLQQAREARGWSRIDVARDTKFQVRQIEALENGAWNELPERAFVRAALRRYAQLLEVDVSPLLDSIGGHAQPEALTIRLRSSEAARVAEMGAEYEPAARRNRGHRLVWGIVGLLAVIALSIYVGGDRPLQHTEQWFSSVFGGDRAESQVADKAAGHVTDSITWTWSSSEEEAGEAPAARISNQ